LGDLGEEQLSVPDDRPLLGVALGATEDGGIVVQQVIRNSAAEQHGIRPGDILLSIDGNAVDSSDSVIQALRDHPRESALKLRLKRRGVELELDIRL
jgi:S1-C subfamily serine protease